MTFLIRALALLIGFLITSSYYIFKEFGVLPKLYKTLEHPDIDYHENGLFISPEEVVYFPEKTTGGKGGLLHFLKTSKYAPQTALPKVMLDKTSFSDRPEDFAIYWLGHSSAILELEGTRILIDPVFDNAAFLPGIVQRYDVSPLKRESLPDLDIVIITHDHYDHLEYKTIKYLSKRENLKFIVPMGVGERLRGWGIPEKSIQELKWDEKAEVKDVEITAMKAIHYSGRSWFDRNQTLWASYGIKSKNKNIFWSGDTGYSEHFKELGDKYGPFDFAGIELDGWNDGWPNTHLYPNEVVKAAKDLKSKVILPIHWATFDLALHPWDESINLLISEAKKENIPVITPIMGEKVIPGVTITKYWWNKNP
ncbi:MAG: MBL fold metallo-hydrolase [Fusobacteriaceae bacterium]